jgi:hypothetical protein
MNATDTAEKAAAPKPTTATLPPVEQSPGCLPKGFDLDSLLTPDQFAVWEQVKVRQIRERLRGLPGVIWEGQKLARIHPRTYLEKRLNIKISAP